MDLLSTGPVLLSQGYNQPPSTIVIRNSTMLNMELSLECIADDTDNVIHFEAINPEGSTSNPQQRTPQFDEIILQNLKQRYSPSRVAVLLQLQLARKLNIFPLEDMLVKPIGLM